jgi:hypothetical protein
MHNQISLKDTAVLPSRVLPKGIIVSIHAKFRQNQNYCCSAVKGPDKEMFFYEHVK